MRGSRTITAARADVVFFRGFTYQLHLDGAPAAVGIWLRIVGKRIEVPYVPPNCGEGPLLVSPTLGKKGLATSGGAHALENGGGDGVLLGFARADYVDGDSLRQIGRASCR